MCTLLWFYKHQHDNRVRSKLFVACQRWWFQWRFAAILVNCAPSGEMYNYCTPHIIKENFENFVIHRCNYILLSQVYCVWQVVKPPPTIIFNNTVFYPTDICAGKLFGLEITNFYVQLIACQFANGCVRRVECGEFPAFRFPCIRYRFNSVLYTGYLPCNVSE